MPPPPSFALFSTAVGECALAWSEAGICGVWLPSTRASGLPAQIARRWRGAGEASPPAEMAEAIANIQAMLKGEAAGFAATRLDWNAVPEFHQRVYAVAQGIPAGRVLTYAAVALRVGSDASAQAVGQALAANPMPIVVPCHRIIAANGRLVGFSAPGGTAMKRRLLAIENARPDGPAGLFDG